MSASARARRFIEQPSATFHGDGRRLHLRHGPIDLILDAEGPAAAVRAAYRRAWRRFQSILGELSAELPVLRRRPDPQSRPPKGVTALRMWEAAAAHARTEFVTPMAAVAGAVADEMLAAMRGAPGLRRIAVNNGGDIALWLGPMSKYVIGLRAFGGERLGEIVFTSDIVRVSGLCGVATSGWRGRSHSLGIADSVTVLAANASMADIAATLIANAVDLPGHPGIVRAPATSLSPDSDLGDRLVVMDAPSLRPEECNRALANGRDCAAAMCEKGEIAGAALFLGGEVVQVGAPQAWPRLAGWGKTLDPTLLL